MMADLSTIVSVSFMLAEQLSSASHDRRALWMPLCI